METHRIGCVIEFRPKFKSFSDIDRLVEDAQGIIYSRAQAVGVDSESLIAYLGLASEPSTASAPWVIQRADFSPRVGANAFGVLSVKVGLNVEDPRAFLGIQAIVAMITDVLRSFGAPQIQGISMFLPSTALRADPTSVVEPLWLGTGDYAGGRRMLATAAVDKIESGDLVERVAGRVAGSRVIRFHESGDVPVPENLDTMALTDPAALGLARTERTQLTSASRWTVTSPAASPDAAAVVLAKLANAVAMGQPDTNLALDVALTDAD